MGIPPTSPSLLPHALSHPAIRPSNLRPNRPPPPPRFRPAHNLRASGQYDLQLASPVCRILNLHCRHGIDPHQCRTLLPPPL
ncbi:hypothetical protein IG631_00650 [Alternaria alternata]|nr:hypothetical protein IG631_00650 [Alternaria alternata]